MLDKYYQKLNMCTVCIVEMNLQITEWGPGEIALSLSRFC